MTGEFVLILLLYIGTPKGTVLAPGQTHFTKDDRGVPYTADTCEVDLIKRVAGMNRKKIRAYRAFCLERP